MLVLGSSNQFYCRSDQCETFVGCFQGKAQEMIGFEGLGFKIWATGRIGDCGTREAVEIPGCLQVDGGLPCPGRGTASLSWEMVLAINTISAGGGSTKF